MLSLRLPSETARRGARRSRRRRRAARADGPERQRLSRRPSRSESAGERRFDVTPLDRRRLRTTRSRGGVRRAAAAAQARRAPQPRPRRRRARRAAHRGRRHHALSLRRQRVPLPHHRWTSSTRCSDWLAAFPATRWAIPSLGPSFGRAIDQARLLRRHPFRCAMMLPCGDPRDAARHGSRAARDRRRGRHAAHPLPEVRGRLRRRRARPASTRSAA